MLKIKYMILYDIYDYIKNLKIINIKNIFKKNIC